MYQVMAHHFNVMQLGHPL